jgi:hypothetical protein
MNYHGLGVLVLLLPCAASLGAGEAVPEGERPKAAAALLAELAAEDFERREEAEKSLLALGPEVLPQLRECAERTEDPEIRARCRRLIKAMALQTEQDAAILAAYAREEALGQRYAQAEAFYAKAAERYNAQAEREPDAGVREGLSAKAQEAQTRQRRAHYLASGKSFEELVRDVQAQVAKGDREAMQKLKQEIVFLRQALSNGQTNSEDW